MDGSFSSNPRPQTGATLIEVLVAMFVIAVGLLGVAGMMSYTMKGNQSAYLRSQATMLAYELTDAMRAAASDARTGLFDDSCADTGNVSCDYRRSWDTQVTSWLGDTASSAVVRNGGKVTVSLTWDDSRGAVRDGQGDAAAAANPEQQLFQLTTEI